MEWETNSKMFEKLKHARLVSAFEQATKIRLYFEKDGKIYRIKIPLTWDGGCFELTKVTEFPYKEIMKIDEAKELMDDKCKLCLEQLRKAEKAKATHVYVNNYHIVKPVNWTKIETEFITETEKLLEQKSLSQYKNVFITKIIEAFEVVKND